MTTLEATLATIEAEGLDRFAYVIGDDHDSSADALVLTRRDGVWTSFATNERAGVGRPAFARTRNSPTLWTTSCVS